VGGGRGIRRSADSQPGIRRTLSADEREINEWVFRGADEFHRTTPHHSSGTHCDNLTLGMSVVTRTRRVMAGRA